MKKNNSKFYVPFILIGILGSCQFSEAQADEEIIQADTEEELDTKEVQVDNESFLSLTKWNTLIGEEEEYYIINYAGIAEEEKAIEKVDLLKKTYPNAGYLWIPNFSSLSGTEVYAVFLDQGNDQTEILKSLENLIIEHTNVYAVKVNQSNERWEAYSSNDIRINGKRINTEVKREILIYQTPQDQEEYEEEGGSDWAYFTDQVTEYFKSKHPEVKVDFLYDSKPSEEIKLLEKELDLESEGFGYILNDGGKLHFISHNMPDVVISQACDFFGFKYRAFH